MVENAMPGCPKCGTLLDGVADDGAQVSCPACHRSFQLLIDEASGEMVLLALGAGKAKPEPLFLPKGSVRATVTITCAVSCWYLIFTDQNVPTHLFGLLLAIIGYYFGFRQRVQAGDERAFAVSKAKEEPLFLPRGFIRLFLIVGFAASAVTLYARGRLGELEYLEFGVILAGLIVGHLFAKLLSGCGARLVEIIVDQIKGLLAIAAAGTLAYLIASGAHEESARLALLCSAAITFYFGSRS